MKILYVTTISNTVNAFLIPHIEMLIDEGHQVDVAFNIEQEIKPEIYEMRCKIHQLPLQRSPLKKDNLRAYKMLKNIICTEGYDLVHTHTPVASAIVRLACRKLSNVKVYYTAHGFHFFKGAPLVNWLVYYPIEKLLSRFTDVLITINEEDYKLANKKKFKAHKVELVHGVGIDLKKFRPQTDQIKVDLRKKHGYRDEDFILIYVGELSYRKHQDTLIRMVEALKEDIPNLKLLLVGKGDYYNEYSSLINSLGLNNFVHLLGYRRDVPELMLLSDIAVSSSRQEGLPVNVMEAMAVGLPLVVSDCRGNRDLVSNNENGYVVEMDDVVKFADSIRELYRSEDLGRKFGHNGLEKIRRYDLENVLKEMESVYSESK